MATMTTTIIPPPTPYHEPFLADFHYYLPPSDSTKIPSDPSVNDLELILGTKDQDTRRLAVHDMRGREVEFTLDKNGFCIAKHESVDKSFSNDDIIRTKYCPELNQLLKRQFPALKQIVLLGHIVRSALRKTDFSGSTDSAWNKPDRGQAPAPRVHIDFTRLGTHLVLVQALGEEEASRITRSGRRFIVLSIWRPIRTVKRDPLGVCDASTVEDDDLVPLKRIYPDGKEGENIVVKAGAVGSECKHKWYWMSNQRSDEVLMIKVFDSEAASGRVTGTPHASFEIACSEDELPRESIEVRAVVCF
jgi:hypothetical protein